MPDDTSGEDTCRWMLASPVASPVRIRSGLFSLRQRRILSKSRPEREGYLSILSSIRRISHHFIHTARDACVVRFVFLLAGDSFISVISLLDTSGKRDSCSRSGICKGIFSSGTEHCCCTLSDNSTCSVSICGICERALI